MNDPTISFEKWLGDPYAASIEFPDTGVMLDYVAQSYGAEQSMALHDAVVANHRERNSTYNGRGNFTIYFDKNEDAPFPWRVQTEFTYVSVGSPGTDVFVQFPSLGEKA